MGLSCIGRSECKGFVQELTALKCSAGYVVEACRSRGKSGTSVNVGKTTYERGYLIRGAKAGAFYELLFVMLVRPDLNRERFRVEELLQARTKFEIALIQFSPLDQRRKVKDAESKK